MGVKVFPLTLTLSRQGREDKERFFDKLRMSGVRTQNEWGKGSE